MSTVDPNDWLILILIFVFLLTLILGLEENPIFLTFTTIAGIVLAIVIFNTTKDILASTLIIGVSLMIVGVAISNIYSERRAGG